MMQKKKRLAKVEAGKKILLQSTEQEHVEVYRLTYGHRRFAGGREQA